MNIILRNMIIEDGKPVFDDCNDCIKKIQKKLIMSKEVN